MKKMAIALVAAMWFGCAFAEYGFMNAYFDHAFGNDPKFGPQPRLFNATFSVVGGQFSLAVGSFGQEYLCWTDDQSQCGFSRGWSL